MLLRSCGARIDWARFATQTRQRQLVVPVRRALRVLAAVLDIEPPTNALATLRAARAPLVTVGVAELSFDAYLRCTDRIPSRVSLPVALARIGALRVRGMLARERGAG
ncbi:hypothetical protein K2Z84_16445 [Candidatus Binatia bacterium]|nr:hypothetical protein [Candidatus Binatia bacterium]